MNICLDGSYKSRNARLPKWEGGRQGAGSGQDAEVVEQGVRRHDDAQARDDSAERLQDSGGRVVLSQADDSEPSSEETETSANGQPDVIV